jgi:hypothetical protein
LPTCSGVLGGLPSNQDIEQIADTNGDGKADLINLNKTTGEVTVLLLNGLNLIGTGSPDRVSTAWEIQD